MKVRVLRGTVANGVAVEPGAVVNVDKHIADYLVRLGKAERMDEPQDAVLVETAATEAPENAMRAKAQKRR